MLRITVLNDVRGAIFKMEGKLTDEWVAEAERAWTTFSKVPQQQPSIVDLCGVSFVDDPGRELLAHMHASGAKLIGTGPMTGALIEEICGDYRLRGGWLRGVLSLFLLTPFAVVISSGNILATCSQAPAPRYETFGAQGRTVAVHQQVQPASDLSGKRHGSNPWKGLFR